MLNLTRCPGNRCAKRYPRARWRRVIRFLQAFAWDEDVDMKERSAEVSLPQFIRYCVDDLKAFYYGASRVQKPGTPSI